VKGEEVGDRPVEQAVEAVAERTAEDQPEHGVSPGRAQVPELEDHQGDDHFLRSNACR